MQILTTYKYMETVGTFCQRSLFTFNLFHINSFFNTFQIITNSLQYSWISQELHS